MGSDALRLYNCRTDCREPRWSDYARLELVGCVDDPVSPGHTVPGWLATDAEFFTIYGRKPDGDTDPITDVQDPRMAIHVAATLAAQSGLDVVVYPQ